MTKKPSNDNINPMWGGHFEQAQSEVMKKINASIDFDRNLYAEDIAGSLAHAEMLAKVGIITKKENEEISNGLIQIFDEIESGVFDFKEELEDIHMNIEARLKEIIGDVAGKLHTARSRNDQVATDFKLWVRGSIDTILVLLQDLHSVLLKKAKENVDTIMPGFTHLQNAQAISFSHHLLAYLEMFIRDQTRFEDCLERLNECPLGAAALAGTSFSIDRDLTARILEFDAPTRNSLDSVSDRDFAMEYLGVVSIAMVHLSRFAEEIVLWCSDGFKFITLSDHYTTGSSIMPQKRNPDAAELIRGKTGRIFGNLNSLLVMMKGLPLAYSKDMQEDKECVFDSTENFILCLSALTGMLKDMKVNKDNMLEAAQKGYTTATDLADYLVKTLKMPFRDAHHLTGKIVRKAEEKKCRLDELSIKDMQEIEPKITKDVFRVLDIRNSVASKKSYGGTSPERIKEVLQAEDEFRENLSEEAGDEE